MSKSVVAVVKGTNPTAMVEEALDLLGGASSMVTSKSKVFLKTNTGHPSAPEVIDCNSPEMVTACIKAFQKAKPKEVVVAETGAVGQNTFECFEKSGHAKAAKDCGTKCVDLKTQMAWTKVTIPDQEVWSNLLVPSILLDPDAFLVCVPIFKLHGGCVITGAVKNWRPVQDWGHREMHFKDLNKAMVEVFAACRPQLSIAELLKFKVGPKTLDVGVIVAGRDAVAVDATCTRILGLPLEAVTHLHQAAKRGLGTVDESEIEIRGKSIKQVFTQVDAPIMKLIKEGIPEYEGYKIYAETACVMCAASAQGIVQAFQRNPEQYEKNKGLTIVVGPRKKLPEGVGTKPGKDKNLILYGNCVAKFRDKGVFVAGCTARGTPTRMGPQTRTDQGDLEYWWPIVERKDVGDNFTGWKGYKPEAKSQKRTRR